MRLIVDVFVGSDADLTVYVFVGCGAGLIF